MIYLFGHKGFLGSAFSRFFKTKKIPYMGIDRNNYSELAGSKSDIFINVNGNSKKYLAEQNPLLDFEMNVMNTFRTFTDFSFKKYIHISTVDVYNDFKNPNHNNEKSIIDPSVLKNYGFSKYLSELIVKKHSPDWLIFRLGGMIGDSLGKNPVFDIVTGNKLYLHPESRMQFINTDDVARIIFSLRNKKNEIYNLCGTGTISLKEISEYAGYKIEKNFYKNPKNIYDINIKKIKKYSNIPKTKETVLKFIEDVKTSSMKIK